MRAPRDLRITHRYRHVVTSFGFALIAATGTFAALSTVAPPSKTALSATQTFVRALPPTPSAPAVRVAIAAPSDLPAVAAARFVPAPTPRPAPLHITTGEIGEGQTLSDALAAQGISSEVIRLIDRYVSPHFDFRTSRPGHTFSLAEDADGRPVEFRYQTSPVEGIRMWRDADAWSVRPLRVEVTPRLARVAGIVATSVYDEISKLGEDPRLAHDYTDIFAWDVDFSRGVQRGDEFGILYERLYRTVEGDDPVYVRPGRVLAARYAGASGEHTAVYFETEEGRGGYYRPDGSSVQGRFLLAPLRYSRISSSYSSARHHPILKVTRPHHGIDYVAAEGTPIWSVADGEVIYRGWAGGFGNLVKVRHARGYVSYYAHLSRFGRSLEVGDRVQQKQVIGYVGQTGLATGPHVCFRMARNGRFVNPTLLKGPAGEAVSPKIQHIFRRTAALRLSELDAGPLVATGEAL